MRLHKYAAFYRGRQYNLQAPDLWTAKKTALSHFGLHRKQERLMAIVLVETADGEKVNVLPQVY